MPDELEISFEEPASPEQPTQEEVEEAYSSAFFNGNEFLSKVPEPDQPIVRKYLEPVMKGWDGGLTEKFNKHKEEVKRWQELGDYEQVQAAHNFYNNFRSNGDQIFGNMVKAFFEHYGDQAIPQMYKVLGVDVSNVQEPTGQQEGWDYSQGEPDSRDIQIQNMQQKIEQFEQWQAQQDEARLEAEAATQLDTMIADVTQSYPNIPQEFIIDRMSAGIFDGKSIEDSWNKFAESVSSQRQRSQPPIVMGGQGSVPSGQVDVRKLDKNGRQALAEQWLAAAQQD